MSIDEGGRKAQAARNDIKIRAAARKVFVREPDAPITDVAHEAGVGISALYRRYPSKEVLLQQLCGDGLREFIDVAGSALSSGADPGVAFTAFLRAIIDADVHALTVSLAGTFTPTPELHSLADEASRLSAKLVLRAKRAGSIRQDVHANDVAMVFEQITAVRLDDPERTRVLRRRYLALLVNGLRPGATSGRLPGSAPTGAELARRWVPT